jgi:hypothetical protein
VKHMGSKLTHLFVRYTVLKMRGKKFGQLFNGLASKINSNPERFLGLDGDL